VTYSESESDGPLRHADRFSLLAVRAQPPLGGKETLTMRKLPLFAAACLTLATLALTAPTAPAQTVVGLHVGNSNFSLGLGFSSHDHHHRRHHHHRRFRRHRRILRRHIHTDRCTVYHRGYWQTYQDRIWAPAEYGYRCDFFGRQVRYVIRPGGWTYVSRRRWIAPYTTYTCGY